MQENKVFWIKVKNSGTMTNVISNGIVPLMKEYSISDYGKINSFHYSEYFDDKKSFWISVNDSTSGFDVVKILCEEFSTPILCYYEDKFYGFNSLGEKIEIPADYENDYGMVATYIEENTGYNFDSDAYFDDFDDEYEFIEDGKDELESYCEVSESNSDSDYLSFNSVGESKKTYLSPNPEDTLKKQEVLSKQEKEESLSEFCSIKNNDGEILNKTKILKFKDPVIANNKENFSDDSCSTEFCTNLQKEKDLYAEDCKESRCSFVPKESKVNEENETVKLETSSKTISSDLNTEFGSADSYCEENDNLKKIKLEEEEINIEDLSNLLNSLEIEDEYFQENQEDKNTAADSDFAINEVLTESQEVSKNIEDDMEISEEELADIIKSYEEQDQNTENKDIESEDLVYDSVSIFSEEKDSDIEFGESSKNGFDSYAVELDSQSLADSDGLEINDASNEEFAYAEIGNIENNDLSYLDEDELVPFDSEYTENYQSLADDKKQFSENLYSELETNLQNLEDIKDEELEVEKSSSSNLPDFTEELPISFDSEYEFDLENLEDMDKELEIGKEEMNNKIFHDNELNNELEISEELEINSSEKCGCACNCNFDEVENKDNREIDCDLKNVKVSDESCCCESNGDLNCFSTFEDQNTDESCGECCKLGEEESCCALEKQDSDESCEECCCQLNDLKENSCESEKQDWIESCDSCCQLYDNGELSCESDACDVVNSADLAFEDDDESIEGSICYCDLEANEEVEDKCFESCGCELNSEVDEQENCDICDSLKNKETVADELNVENWKSEKIDLSSINENFGSDEQELTEDVDLNISFSESSSEDSTDTCDLDNKQESNDFYVPFHLEDSDIENINLVKDTEPDSQLIEEIKLSQDFDSVEESVSDLPTNINDTLVEVEEIKLDLSDLSSSNLEEIDLVNVDEKSLDEINNVSDLEEINDEVLNSSLKDAKNRIESDIELADELKRFLEELNIERKKLAEKKSIIAKRNEEAKKLFASNYYQKEDLKNLK
ncbi:MAG: hypothetical protein K2I67_03170 [Malacoplasma sp.]|nr:hypothetical protein [Malacoplasma sp.]